MSYDDKNMGREDDEQQGYPADPPQIAKVTNLFDESATSERLPVATAIPESSEIPPRSQTLDQNNRQRLPSSTSGNEHQIDQVTSFISSSSSSIPLKGARHIDSEPEEMEQERLSNNYLYSANHGQSNHRDNHEMHRYGTGTSPREHNNNGIKFYDSDVDSQNGSLVYNGQGFRHMSQQSKNNFPSLSSIGSLGSDSEVYRADEPHGLQYSRSNTTPVQSVVGSKDGAEEEFLTPNISNITRQRDRSNYETAAENASNNFDPMKNTNGDVLPYQARKQITDNHPYYSDNNPHNMNATNSANKYVHENEQQRQQPRLSTIAGGPQEFQGNSPTNLYSRGLPPSGSARHRTYSKENASGTDNDGHPSHRRMKMKRVGQNQGQPLQQPYHIEEDEFSLRNQPKPPSMHLRMESSGSISSLGSALDGAASMIQMQSRRINEKLTRELQQYHDDNIGDSQHFSQREESRPMSSFFDSLSVISGGSMRSIDDERADYRKKSQKIIQKKEKMKQRQQKRNSGGWFPEFSNKNTSMRSLSPAARSQRAHRPKLPSIDNDTWDEAELSDGLEPRPRRSEKKKKNTNNVRPPMRKKQGSSSRGSSRSKSYRDDHRVRRSDRRRGGLNTTQRISNTRKSKSKSYSSSSQSSEISSEDDSYISSDFTSNQFGAEDEDSSVYVEEDDLDSDSAMSFDEEENNERTSLLPSGISTDEPRHQSNNRYYGSGRPPAVNPRSQKEKKHRDDRQRDKGSYRDPQHASRKDRSRSKRSRNRSHRSARSNQYYGDGDPYSRDLFYEERLRMERKIRKKMMKELEERRCCNRFGRWIGSIAKRFCDDLGTLLCKAESFIGNLPLTIGAVALAVVTLGVVWFKFTEEMIDACVPVHFHSKQCTFPEFPGCFYCDKANTYYKAGVYFHYGCSAFAGFIVLLFFLKICISRKTVMDEMNSPTTSSPAGLMCMTMVCVFAGRGAFGQFMVTFAAGLHFIVAIWFIYMAAAYNILPDPSWYPNTVGIGISAVKTWLYYPMPGHFLMLTSLMLQTMFFPISLVRVACNEKVSAPVSWIQMSAPAVSLYAWTIMAQPSFEEEFPDINYYQHVHRILYLPIMHCLFAAALVGAFSSVQSLHVRWKDFKQREFTPAHAAFCFPTLAHANSVQAYRGALNSFSNIPSGSTIKIIIDVYWMFVLVGGTIATFIITAKFFYMLPTWTRPDVDDEVEPPAPSDTIMSEIITAGETFRQNFVSPAVLQANETGALVQVRKDGRTKYVRTRKVTALGFDPIMEYLDFEKERDALLDWVMKNPPRQRKRTLSVPGITRNIGDFGRNNLGIYTGSGSVVGSVPTPGSDRRQRARTSDDYNLGESRRF